MIWHEVIKTALSFTKYMLLSAHISAAAWAVYCASSTYPGVRYESKIIVRTTCQLELARSASQAMAKVLCLKLC